MPIENLWFLAGPLCAFAVLCVGKFCLLMAEVVDNIVDPAGTQPLPFPVNDIKETRCTALKPCGRCSVCKPLCCGQYGCQGDA